MTRKLYTLCLPAAKCSSLRVAHSDPLRAATTPTTSNVCSLRNGVGSGQSLRRGISPCVLFEHRCEVLAHQGDCMSNPPEEFAAGTSSDDVVDLGIQANARDNTRKWGSSRRRLEDVSIASTQTRSVSLAIVHNLLSVEDPHAERRSSVATRSMSRSSVSKTCSHSPIPRRTASSSCRSCPWRASSFARNAISLTVGFVLAKATSNANLVSQTFDQRFIGKRNKAVVGQRQVDICKTMRGFLMMFTRCGKLLYISENASEYLGYSVVSSACTATPSTLFRKK